MFEANSTLAGNKLAKRPFSVANQLGKLNIGQH